MRNPAPLTTIYRQALAPIESTYANHAEEFRRSTSAESPPGSTARSGSCVFGISLIDLKIPTSGSACKQKAP
jgi:hypothetical protein